MDGFMAVRLCNARSALPATSTALVSPFVCYTSTHLSLLVARCLGFLGFLSQEAMLGRGYLWRDCQDIQLSCFGLDPNCLVSRAVVLLFVVYCLVPFRTQVDVLCLVFVVHFLKLPRPERGDEYCFVFYVVDVFCGFGIKPVCMCMMYSRVVYIYLSDSRVHHTRHAQRYHNHTFCLLKPAKSTHGRAHMSTCRMCIKLLCRQWRGTTTGTTTV